ncbi:DUF6702 family protein [Candidatus Uabimicrobium amorphum]|uniref:POTRA domain-containing protein n=1 Tax=Uabimicrobium amorphum TaxID=2596890 RepID=A0A5S9IKQ6_UABAM|nr:DUF6702 family protein [Candidatus Uabimicrobium amorphum]BBM83236.1 hypothetical protein UABAM_01587 [Candidatus Uabimicrobium amorphum]
MKKLVVILFLCSTFLFAHRYHFTISEVEWNSQNKCLEVGLRVDSFELESVLSKIYGKKIDLEKTKDVDKILHLYLQKRFLVKTPQRKPCSIVWIGKEISRGQLWLYFEVPVKEPLEGLIISNSVLFEAATFEANSSHTPVNIMNIRYKQHKLSLYFTKDKAQRILSFAKK